MPQAQTYSAANANSAASWLEDSQMLDCSSAQAVRRKRLVFGEPRRSSLGAVDGLLASGHATKRSGSKI